MLLIGSLVFATDKRHNLCSMTEFKTTQAKTTALSMIKPGELVDVVELTPLRLADRRTFNLLIAAAWDTIAEDVEHVISKRDLRTQNNNANDRLDETIGRLMGARVRVKIQRDGKEYIRSVSLLETVEAPVRADGQVYYRFPRPLRRLISDSSIFARLSKEVMLNLSSKYALALYEMVQKRGNLTHKTTETFTVQELRDLLGVPPDKLGRYNNFKSRALAQAVTEVNGLAEHGVAFSEIRKGKTVTHIELSWWKKSEEELRAAYAEIKQPRFGRSVRLSEKSVAETKKRRAVIDSLPK
jgi:plasmid replication initiation protein